MDQTEYALPTYQNILKATLTFWFYAETWLFFIDGYRIWAWLCGCCRSKKRHEIESIGLLEAQNLVIDLKDGLATWSVSLLSGFVEGLCKNMWLKTSKFFTPFSLCHTLSPFALNPFPCHTQKSEKLWAENEPTYFGSHVCLQCAYFL